MKIKTSVTLSANLLELIDKWAEKARQNRSDFIEASMWDVIRHLARDEEDARDLAIINRRADFLNREAADVLRYQKPL